MVSEIHHLDYKGILSISVHGAWDTKQEQLSGLSHLFLQGLCSILTRHHSQKSE